LSKNFPTFFFVKNSRQTLFLPVFFPILFKTRDLPQNVLKKFMLQPHKKNHQNGKKNITKNISTVVIFFLREF